MPDGFHRTSPLADVAKQGRHGADRGAPGVSLSVQHPQAITMVIARKGKAKSLVAALNAWPGEAVQWAGADQYYVLGIPFPEVRQALGQTASCSEQSHGRIIIRVAGPKARALLAKGTPVDLHPSMFAIGQCAVTQMAHVGVHLSHPEQDVFDLSVFRGFAESFWEWLTKQAEEFGYLVR
jgi:heterotetrameric sarcosine oxidase gamma subunit